MSVIRCVTIVGPFSTLPGPSFTPEHIVSAPKAPHGRFLEDLAITFQALAVTREDVKIRVAFADTLYRMPCPACCQGLPLRLHSRPDRGGYCMASPSVPICRIPRTGCRAGVPQVIRRDGGTFFSSQHTDDWTASSGPYASKIAVARSAERDAGCSCRKVLDGP